MKKFIFILVVILINMNISYSQSWSSLGSGMNNGVFTLFDYNNELIAGGYFTTAGGANANYIAKWGTGIGVQNISTETPSKYSLSRNYLNPFNPTTKIKFSVPLWRGLGGRNNNGAGLVTLKVFDITGKEVATLVNEKLHPGTYETDWKASAYSSGVYFYKIQVGEFTETKKMTLIK